jgi:hypothetical protein
MATEAATAAALHRIQEEYVWKDAAAAVDGGKGIELQFVSLNNDTDIIGTKNIKMVCVI